MDASEFTPRKGGCHCGHVVYQLTEPPLTCYACHCTECQAISGSAFSISMIAKSQSVQVIQGQTQEKTHQKRNGPVLGHCCPECGTFIMFIAPNAAGFVAIKAGTFFQKDWFQPVAHLWTRSAQPWLKLDDSLTRFSQQPTIEVLLGLKMSALRQ